MSSGNSLLLLESKIPEKTASEVMFELLSFFIFKNTSFGPQSLTKAVGNWFSG